MEKEDVSYIKPFKFAYKIESLIGNELIFILILAAFIGVGGGYGAVAVIKMIDWFTSLFFFKGSTLDALMALPWYYKLLPPVVGGIIVGPIVGSVAKETKGHGVPEVMHRSPAEVEECFRGLCS